jgi:hypothetical protein
VNTAVGGQITVKRTAPANNGDAVRKYYLTEYKDGAQSRTLTATGTEKVIQDLSTDSTYTYTVQAENKAGKSPVSAQSNEVVPYGTPDTPGTPNASLGSTTSGQADVRWNAIGQFRGTGHRYEVQANGAGAKDAGNNTAYTYTGLSNGTSYTFQVRACNAYVCSDWSAASNAVTPYGKPPTPSISASGGDQQVTFTWDGRATNGRPIASVRVTGAFTSTATNGTQSVSTGYSTPEEACVTVTDTEGQEASKCASATSNARPDPRAWVTRGSPVNNSDCSTAACANYMVNTQDFPAGNHEVACWAGDTPEVQGWHDIVTHGRTWADSSRRTYNIPANGQVQLRCFFGHAGRQVAVMIDGTRYEARNW